MEEKGNFYNRKKTANQRDKKKGGKSTNEDKYSKSEALNETLEESIKRITTALDEEKRRPCHMVLVLHDAEKKEYDESESITHNLITRLYKKDGALLLNPYSEELTQPRPITPSELKEIQAAEIDFKEDDVLYISGHANMFSMGSLDAGELADKLEAFLQSTGIKKVKLAGCHTGSFADETQLRLMKKWDPKNSQEVMRYNEEQIKALTSAFAKKLSAELYDRGVYGVQVYGYIGEVVEADFEKKFYEKGQKKNELHSSVSIYEGRVDSEGNGELSKQKPVTIRASEARVCYVDGVQVEGIKNHTVSENFRKDHIAGDVNREGKAVDIVRRMKF